MGSRIIYFFVVFMFIYNIVCTCPAYGATDSDADSYVKKVYNCNYEDLFREYCELNLVHTQLLSSIQGKTLDSDTKKSVDLMVSTLEGFDRIYSLSESQKVEDHLNALEAAFTIQSNIESLKNYTNANKEGYPLLFSIAIERYFKKEGSYFHEIASKEKNTNNRVLYLEKSALAYKNGGKLNLYSEITYDAENEKQIYTNDIKAAKSLASEADTFISNYGSKGELLNSGFNLNFLYQVNAFVKGNEALEGNQAAIDLYKKHDSEEELNISSGKNEKLGQINFKAFSNVLFFMGIISLIYLAISIYICSSITRWYDEVKNANSGDELLEGLILV